MELAFKSLILESVHNQECLVSHPLYALNAKMSLNIDITAHIQKQVMTLLMMQQIKK